MKYEKRVSMDKEGSRQEAAVSAPLPECSNFQETFDRTDPDHAAFCLALTPGIGPRHSQALIDALGSPVDVLNASPSAIRQVPGIGAKLASAIALAPEQVDVLGERQRCREHQIELLSLERENGYPRRLKEVSDPPQILFSQGSLTPEDELAIAIVGTRHATPYGLRQAERLARGLATAGLTVVSGLARGIDAAAHRGALEAGGRTLAVLGSGLLNLYPAEHQSLAQQIAQHGAVLSEYPTQQPPKRGAFPQRNRLVTGLSLGVIVVEAPEHSGALISARLAAEQGREVFAVPGPIDQRASRGCHRLIRDGAKLVESVEDVLEELGPLATPCQTTEGTLVTHPVEVTLNEQERLVLDAVFQEPTEVDAIVERTELPTHRVLATLSVLEMRHLIRRLSGSSVTRC